MESTKALVVAILLVAAQGLIRAQENQPPVISAPSGATIRGLDLARLAVEVSDPDTSPSDLTYSWSIPPANDPTGAAFFYSRGAPSARPDTATGSSAVTLGLDSGASGNVGRVITVHVEVSDGVNTEGADIPVTVSGVNQEPVLVVDDSRIGTFEDPRLYPGGVGLDATASYDPDGGGVHVLWHIANVASLGGCGVGSFALIGFEGPTPAMTIPLIQDRPDNPARVTIQATVADGLIILTQNFTAYVASPNGCNGADTGGPEVRSIVASPLNATYGQRVTLTADAPSGLSYSWVQLGTTGAGNTVVLSGANSRSASFTAPSFTTTLHFRFTVSDGSTSASRDISVQVSSGGGGGPSGDTGTPSGTSTGQTVAGSCSGGNQAPLAEVPESFTIESGNVAAITASNGRDPDNTVGAPVGGATGSGGGVGYQWRLVNGAGVLTATNLTNTGSATVRVNTPARSDTRTATLEVIVSDPLGCATSYPVQLVMTPAQTQNPSNLPPSARAQFTLSGSTQEAAGQSLQVSCGQGKLEVPVSASLSSDSDGSIQSYQWLVNQSGFAGSVVGVFPSNEPNSTLSIDPCSAGQVEVRLRVTDDGGASTESARFTLNVTVPDNPPIAEAAVRIGMGPGPSIPLGPEDAVAPGDPITLDATSSRLEDGSQPQNMTYFWRPVGCDGLDTCIWPVNPNGAVTSIRAPRDVTDWKGGDRLEYELLVGHNGVQSDPVTVTIPFQQRRYLAQVAAGALGPTSYLQTTVVLTNPTGIEVEVFIDFFDDVGQALTFELDGEPADGPYVVPPFSTQELQFRAPAGEILQGWGVVRSDRPVAVITQYQVINLETNRPTRQVSLFSSAPDSRFSVHFKPRDDMAIAVANPGAAQVTVRFTLSSGRSGSGLQLLTSLQLGPGEHIASFIREIFQEVLDDVGLSLENLTGTRLRIEVEGGRVVLTSLITQGLLPFATNPPVRLQEQ